MLGIAKAVIAGLIAGLSAVLPALGDGHVTLTEGITIASATLAAGYAVWRVPNAGSSTEE